MPLVGSTQCHLHILCNSGKRSTLLKATRAKKDLQSNHQLAPNLLTLALPVRMRILFHYLAPLAQFRKLTN